MDSQSFKPSRRFLFVAFAVAALVLAGRVAAASAATYCVADPACPAGGIVKPSLDEAIAAANKDAALDTVRIGPGEFSPSAFVASNPVDLVGAGSGATTVKTPPGLVGTFIRLTSASKVSDLAIEMTATNQEALRLAEGSDAARIEISASHAFLLGTGIYVEGPGSDIRSVKVDIGPGVSGYGIGDGGGATIEDTEITAGIGLLPAKSGTTARRVTIHAHNPLYVIGGSLNIANALLLPYPDDSEPGYFIAADVTGGNAGESASLAMADTTVVGPGGGQGVGIDARSNNSVNVGTVSVSLQGVLIDQVGYSIIRHGKSGTQTANVGIEHSAYDAARINDGSGNGSIALGAGNLTGGVDPGFVDPAAGDYRPRFDSPLLDAGPPMLPLAGDDPDLAGKSRVRDSDGNGSAVRDIGAYEYQRLAPVPALAITPAAAAPGEALGFGSAGSVDPDGDPVSYAWSFGDGASAAGSQASHAYASTGNFPVTLTATDATGLSATATAAASVVAPDPGRPGGAPVLSRLSQSARSWVEAAAAGAAASRLPVGTRFRFRLDRAAGVHLTFSRRVGKRLVPVGTLTRAGQAGANVVRFRGRISAGHRLVPGRYKLTAVAVDAAGQRSGARSLSFRVLAP